MVFTQTSRRGNHEHHCLFGIGGSGYVSATGFIDAGCRYSEISIHYTQDNASVNEIENSITNLLRGQLQQIPSLSDITSESREGSGTITMKFEYGTSIDYAFIEVNQKVDAAMNSFPKEMQRPTIIKASTSDIPVFYIQLNLKNWNRISNSWNFANLPMPF